MSTQTLSLFFLIASNILSQNSEKPSALLIHNIQYFELTHSDLLQELRSHYKVVDCVKTSQVTNFSVKLYDFKKPVYDLAILILPSSAKAMEVVEKLELLKFFDEGNPILLFGSGSAVQSWRILLSQFGFDHLTVDRGSGNGQLFSRNFDSRIFLGKEAVPFGKMREGLRKGIVFDGGAISLTPYENSISWTLLEAPENALFLEGGKPRQLVDRNKMNLVVGAQGTNNKARIAAVGSFKMFSNELNTVSEGDNIRYLGNLIKWLNFKSQVLKIKNFVICNEENKSDIAKINCLERGAFRQKQRIGVRFQIFDENGQFYIPEEGKIYVHVTKQVTILNVEANLIQINGENFYHHNLGHFETGVYKVSLVHNKPGFHLDSQDHVKMMNVLPNHIESIEIFSLEGLPFFILIAVVAVSALNTMRLLLLMQKEE